MWSIREFLSRNYEFNLLPNYCDLIGNVSDCLFYLDGLADNITDEGMVREVKPIQPEKHSRPNDVTEDGMVREVKPVQPEKQLSPNEVTEEGIAMEVKPVQ